MAISSRTGLRAAACCALLCAALLSACGGGGSAAPGQPSQPTQPSQPSQPVATELTLTSSSAGVSAGGAAVTLNASLNGTGSSINWALAAGSPGALSATSGASVSYTPPASFTGITAVTVIATSGSLSKNIVLALGPTAPGLTLLAGTITPGHASIDGRGSAARFSSVNALATDSSGAIYVGDGSYGTQRPQIRKVSADGTVSTLKADWNVVNGASINAITAMADGSLYFSDVQFSFMGSTVYYATTTFRKLGADGKLTTLGVAGGSSYVAWQLVAAPDGTLYVCDNSAIYTLGSDGSRQLLAGDSNAAPTGDVDGAGSVARFYGISRVQVAPDGTLYLLDSYGLRRVSKAGVVTTLVTQDGLASPQTAILDLSLDAQGNPLLLYPGNSTGAYQIRTFSGGALSTVYALDTANHPGHPYLSKLLGMADGSVITSDLASLDRTGTDGKTTTLAGVRIDTWDTTADGQGAAARLINPGMLAADHDGNIYAAEAVGSVVETVTIRKITPAGVVSTYASANLSGYISGMVMTAANTLVISVQPVLAFGGAVYQVSQDHFTLIAGGSVYDAPLVQKDGQGSAAAFGRPALAGADKDGNLYLSDQSQTYSAVYSIRKVTPQGAVTTVDRLPAGLSTAADGNVYQVNNTGTAVVRLAPDGTRTVLAGIEGGQPTNLPGPLPALLYDVRSVTPLGGKVFAVAAGHGIYTLVLP